MPQSNLNEILHPKMDILFLGLNPPRNSNTNGKYFSNNLSFWNLLHRSGLIAESILNKLDGQDLVFRNQQINYKNASYGVTDLVHDIVETNSTKVKIAGSQIKRITDILDNYDCRILCLMHSRVAKKFKQSGLIDNEKSYGEVGRYKSTMVFNVPFHCASIANKEYYYQILKRAMK